MVFLCCGTCFFISVQCHHVHLQQLWSSLGCHRWHWTKQYAHCLGFSFWVCICHMNFYIFFIDFLDLVFELIKRKLKTHLFSVSFPGIWFALTTLKYLNCMHLFIINLFTMCHGYEALKLVCLNGLFVLSYVQRLLLGFCVMCNANRSSLAAS